MAQTKLEYATLAVAKKTGDEVQGMVASTDGETFSSEQRINAINGARQNIYNELYNSLQPEKFGDMYPEFITESANFVIVANIGLVPDDAKFIYSVRIRTANTDPDSSSKDCKPIPKEVSYEAQYDTYSVYKADTNNYKYFFVDPGHVKVLGSTIANGLINYIYLMDIVPVVLDDDNEDMPDPYTWLQLIIDEATKILLTDQQLT